MIGFSEGKLIVRATGVIVNAGGQFIWWQKRPGQVGQKIVIAIGKKPSDTTDVCKLASPFQDMVNPQVNLFQ